ncbi:uncharacterized protein LOC143497152 [Brachyhypopomus gauderio]|uniref:uncharacterized protein LOC143497152 n=1 Tax=Brachyhypopomus gauderio TaxID=698409 RepID=UPI0040418E78
MGAKLSRRRSEGPAGEGAVVGAPAQDQPATPQALSAPEITEQDLGGPDDTQGAKPEEAPPTVADSKPVPGALEVIANTAEETVAAISQQIAKPVEDVLNKSIGAMEAMMTAVGIKDEATEPAAADPEPKPETLVDLAEETPKMIFSTPKPPEDLAYLPSDLLSSQPNPEALIATADDVAPVVVESEEIPSQFDIHVPPECKELLAGMNQDAEPPAEPLNCDFSVEPSTLNSDPLVDLGDIGQAMITAVNTINDLI